MYATGFFQLSGEVRWFVGNILRITSRGLTKTGTAKWVLVKLIYLLQTYHGTRGRLTEVSALTEGR